MCASFNIKAIVWTTLGGKKTLDINVCVQKQIYKSLTNKYNYTFYGSGIKYFEYLVFIREFASEKFSIILQYKMVIPNNNNAE